MVINVDNSSIICPIFKYNEFFNKLLESGNSVNLYDENLEKVFLELDASAKYSNNFIKNSNLLVIPARKDGEINEDYWKVLEMLRISRKGYKTRLKNTEYLRFFMNSKKYDLKFIQMTKLMAIVIIEERVVNKEEENKNSDQIIYSTNFSNANKGLNDDFKSQLLVFKQKNEMKEDEAIEYQKPPTPKGVDYFNDMYFGESKEKNKPLDLLPQYQISSNMKQQQPPQPNPIFSNPTPPINKENEEYPLPSPIPYQSSTSSLELQHKIVEFTNILMDKYEELVNPETSFDYQASFNDTIKRLDDRATIMAKFSNIREKRKQLSLILSDESLDDQTKIKFIDILLGAMGYERNKTNSSKKSKEESKLRKISESVSPMARFEERFSKARSI